MAIAKIEMHNEIIKGLEGSGVWGKILGGNLRATLSNVKLYAERRLAATEMRIMSFPASDNF